MGKWIPCSQELPDDDTTVMTYIPGDDNPVWPGYHDGEEWVGLDHFAFTGTVTHWQPFPDPPSEPSARSEMSDPSDPEDTLP